MWIRGLDQTNLLVSTPALNFLLSIDGVVWVSKRFVVYQACEVIAAGKAWKYFVLMLEDSAQQISGHACVQHVRPLPIRHDVDVKAFGTHD
jgi:hypothetical protein